MNKNIESIKPREKLTPFPELDLVMIEHANKLKETLKDNFIGYYLTGSLAVGDFDRTSDVDFIVVTKSEPSKEELDAVSEIHKATYNQDNRWVKRLEYSLFPFELLKEASSPYIDAEVNSYDAKKLWYFDNGSLRIERSDHDNNLVNRWVLREKGIAVLGPDPKTLVNPVSSSELQREIKDTIIYWGEELLKDSKPYENRFYQAYLVLNFCRMFQDYNEARITSKLDGVKWGKTNLNKKWMELIDYCWQERQDENINIRQPKDPRVFKQSLAFVEYIVNLAKNSEKN